MRNKTQIVTASRSQLTKPKNPMEPIVSLLFVTHLGRGTADEEPLVDGGINLLRGEILVGRQRRQGLGGNAAGRVLDSHVGAANKVSRRVRSSWHVSWNLDLRRDAAGLGLASDETLPGLSALADDIHGVAGGIVS